VRSLVVPEGECRCDPAAEDAEVRVVWATHQTIDQKE